MATYTAVAVTFVLTLVITGSMMVLLQPQNWFDVKEQDGAVGATDVTTLQNLWEQACNGTGKFELSTGNSQIGPLLFKGPCKVGTIEVSVIGDVIAISKNIWPSNTDTWIKFQNVPNLHVIGQNGRFIGQGADWWNACRRTRPTTCEKNNPTALAFHGCLGLVLDQVTSIDSPRNHISINACNGATISGINIQAPGIGAPNTDGIDISDTIGLNVNGGHIGTGDDCIAINAGSSNINITILNCGPGHGISVGSLGRNFAHESVSNINVIGATFDNTQNGVRIKTVPRGSGSANQIIFKNIGMINVQHPIILTHFYCPHKVCNQTETPSSVVQIKDVSFIDIHGTCTSDDAINIQCARNTGGCVGITIGNINIQNVNSSVKVGSTCLNTNVRLIPPVIPSVNCVPKLGLIEMPGDDNYEKGQEALMATS